MQEALSLDTPKAPVLAKDKLAKAANAPKEKDESKGTDFLAMMLSQIENSGTKKPAIITIGTQALPAKVKIDLKSIESLSEEKATFAQLLTLIEALNGGQTPLKFPKLSQKLESLLTQEGLIKELKEVKSLHDVMKLSQKYDLGLEKITLSSKEIKQFEALFPKLAQQNFFEPKRETIMSETLLKSKQTEANAPKPEKEEHTTLKDLLRAFEGKKEAKTDVKTDVKPEIKADVKADVKGNGKVDVKPEIKIDTKPDGKTDAKSETKGEVKPELKADTKTETKAQIVVEAKKEAKIETKIAPKEAQALAEKTTTEAKQTPKATITQEVRVESAKMQPAAVEIKEPTPAPQAPKDAAFKALGELSQGEARAGEREPSSQEGEAKNQNTFSKEVGKQDQSSLKTPQLRQTFNTFAQDFKEQVESYKPPMMKIQLALNPKNLGEVDVTLINRGNNLHVNITSNTSQTLSLFVQNQAEFKNALVNMGFTNLEMNFSQKERQDNPQGGNSKEGFSSEEFNDSLEEETTLELVLPNYV